MIVALASLPAAPVVTVPIDRLFAGPVLPGAPCGPAFPNETAVDVCVTFTSTAVSVIATVVAD